MAKSQVLLSNALVPESRLKDHVRTGLSALKTRDVNLIAETERPKVGDSIDLDSATRDESPSDNRWDYLLSVPTVSHIVGLEPHSARDSEVSVVIAKKKHAMTYLRDHLPPKHAVTRWIWVTHGKVRFTKMERARRQLDQNGIAFEGRLLKSLDGKD